MARRLDAQFFDYLSTRTDSGVEYEAYRVRNPNSTIVLFPVDEPTVPIAAFTFLPRALGTNAKTVISRRQKSANDASDTPSSFQAMTNVENDEFKFVISNLVSVPNVNDQKFVKIDILDTDTKVNKVDYPERGINKINELKSGQSFVVESDQRTGERTMVLRGEVTADGSKMLVDDDDEKEVGTYFYVNVTATNNMPDIVKLLTANTTWRSVDVFVRKLASRDGQDYFDDMSRFRNAFNGQPPMFSGGGSSGNAPSYAYGALSSSSFGGARVADGAQSRFSFGGASSAAFTRNAGFSAPLSGQTWSLAQDRHEAKVSTTGAMPSQQQIGATQLGTMVKGSQVVHVDSNKTGAQYAYEAVGERIVIGLSVWRDMQIYNALAIGEDMQLATVMLNDAIVNKSLALRAELKVVFDAAECVVCLENPPSLVTIRCGHKCMCQECWSMTTGMHRQKCPVCRGRIVAMLPDECATKQEPPVTVAVAAEPRYRCRVAYRGRGRPFNSHQWHQRR